MPAGQAIREELWRWGLIELLGTNSGTETDYIIDATRLKSDSLSGSAYDDCYIRCTKSDNGAPDGEQVKVDYLDTANGYLYITPVFSAALDATSTYEVWKAGIDPDDVDRARDEALTRLCSMWYMHPVSEVINASYVDAVGEVVSITKVIDHAALSDGGDATAYIDFDDEIPAGSVITAVICDFTEAFNSDDTTTLTMMIGPQADLDAYNKTADPGEDAFNHTTDVSWGKGDCQEPWVATAATPRVTFTEDDDGTDVINSGSAAGGVTITITYIKPLGNWELLLKTGSGTIAKSTLSFPSEFAMDTILCTNVDTANEGAESASLYVQPGQSFYLYAPVSVRSGTAEVVVRDVTQGAAITTNGTATETLRGWSGIELTFTIPSGCGEITIRLLGQGTTDIVEWGPVYLHRQGQKRIQIPSRVLSREHIGPVFCISNPPVTGSATYWGEEEIEEVMGVRRQQVGDAVLLRFEGGMSNAPHAYSERFFYSALSTGYQTAAQRVVGDAATTLCPIDYVVPAMVRVLAEQYMHKQPGQIEFWTNLRMEALRQLEPMERTYGPLPMPTQERGRVVSVPTLRV